MKRKSEILRRSFSNSNWLSRSENGILYPCRVGRTYVLYVIKKTKIKLPSCPFLYCSLFLSLFIPGKWVIYKRERYRIVSYHTVRKTIESKPTPFFSFLFCYFPLLLLFHVHHHLTWHQLGMAPFRLRIKSKVGFRFGLPTYLPTLGRVGICMYVCALGRYVGTVPSGTKAFFPGMYILWFSTIRWCQFGLCENKPCGYRMDTVYSRTVPTTPYVPLGRYVAEVGRGKGMMRLVAVAVGG